MTILELAQIMAEHGAALRAIPLKVREIYEKHHTDQFSDGRIIYWEEFKREMLVVERIPKNAGKFIVEGHCGTDSTVRFRGATYYDTIEDAIYALIRAYDPASENHRSKDRGEA